MEIVKKKTMEVVTVTRKEYEILLPVAEDVKCRTGCCFQACGCVPTKLSTFTLSYTTSLSHALSFKLAESCSFTADCGRCISCMAGVQRCRVEVPWTLCHGENKCCICTDKGADNPCCETSETCCAFGTSSLG
jgi:hypothetical protein